MLMIILVHANYASLYAPNKNDILIAPLSSFWRIFAEQLCVVGANVFVLISGWFGIKASIKGLLSLLFQVVFWGSFILLLGIVLKLDIPIHSIAKVFWFGSYYWFVIAYVVLYLLSPVLNSFIETVSPRQYLTVLFCLFTAELVYGWIIYSEEFNQGYSVISFVNLYLLARFISLYSYKLKATKFYSDILIYLLLTFIPSLISFLGIRNGWKTLHPIYYSSPFVIAASLFLLLAFSKTSINNKAINWIACSTFSVYLIHLHPIIFPFIIETSRHLSEVFSTVCYTCIVLLLAIVLLMTCVLLDKIRITTWKFLCSHGFDKLIHRLEVIYETVLDKLGYRL